MGFEDAAITTTNSDPLLIFSNLQNNAVLKNDDDIVLRFDEAITTGNGNIVISCGNDVRTIVIDDASQVTIQDDLVIINPTTDLDSNSTYNFQMAPGVITDTVGNAFAGIDGASFNTTADPILVESFSSPGLFFVANSDIVLYFNEAVTAGNGKVIISDGTDVRFIANNDTSQVRFETIDTQSGLAFSSVTINPTDDLIADSVYSIQIESGAIEDLDGNSYAGINDTTTLDFTTADPTIFDPFFPITSFT